MKAGEAVLELPGQARGGAGELLVVLGRDDHRDLGGYLAVVGGRQRAGRRASAAPAAPGSARRARHSPVCAARGAARSDQHPGAPLEVGAELGGAGDDVAAVGHLASEDGGDEGSATSSLSHSGERERSSSSASRVVTMRAIAGSGAPRAR